MIYVVSPSTRSPILSLSDLCPGVEKKIQRKNAISNNMTKMATL